MKTLGILGGMSPESTVSYYMNINRARGIEPIVPDDEAKHEVHRIIFDELCLGKITVKSKTYYLKLIDKLTTMGAEGVILGCTEIGLLIKQEDSALPFFDTAMLHSKMAIDFILEK